MIPVLVFVSVLLVLCCGKKAKAAVYREKELIRLDKEALAGGAGTVLGRYAFTRDTPPKEHAVKEIAWLTLEPGCSIGLHEHVVNEDLYMIISGTGTYTDADGSLTRVQSGDITIARRGDSHALANTGAEPLVFVSVIAE